MNSTQSPASRTSPTRPSSTQPSSNQPAFTRSSFTRRETVLVLALVLGLLIALFGPHLTQHAHYHAFADQRAFLGLPCAMDVLSNLPFALAGLIGLGLWLRWVASDRAGANAGTTSRHLPDLAALFFLGLIVTAAGSIWYHLNPSDTSLVVDRLGMVAGFAGMLGLAAAHRVSARAGVATVIAVLVLGPASVAVWFETGNLLPWAVLQGGGLLMLLALSACRPAMGSPVLRLLPVVVVYTLAKLLELGDQTIFEWTHHLVSGHSLKHVVAALAAWPVISFMHNQSKAAKTWA